MGEQWRVKKNGQIQAAPVMKKKPEEEYPPLMAAEEAEHLTALVKQLPADACILEYGCGGSSLLFQSLLGPDQWLYSVEHNKDWFNRIEQFLVKQATMYYVGLEAPYAKLEEELPTNAHGYICPPDLPWDRIKLVFVDGIARGACLATVLSICQPGTKVVLHDYVGREWWYDWAVKLYPEGTRVKTMIDLTVPSERQRPVPTHVYKEVE